MRFSLSLLGSKKEMDCLYLLDIWKFIYIT